MTKVVSLCFEVCYLQRNALSVKKSKAKTAKIRHVSQDIRHLLEIPQGKGLWDTIRSSSGFIVYVTVVWVRHAAADHPSLDLNTICGRNVLICCT